MSHEPQQLELVITGDGDAGRVRFVWDDSLAPLLDEGSTQIVRVGDVEPALVGVGPGVGWLADLGRCGGGLFGPFPLRQAALDFERTAVSTYLREGRI